MNFWKSIQGMVRVELTGADLAASISAVNQAGISLFYLEIVDPVTVVFRVYRSQLAKLRSLTEKRGDSMRIVGKAGSYWTLRTMTDRPLFVIGMILILSLALFLPTRIFFVRVEGNRIIPTRAILEQAELCGIRFGTSRRAVRSERMKNALLSAIPELQWAGINTSGCTAVISVRERAESESSVDEKYAVSRIVALRDAVVTQCTVTRGNALCQVGQAVTTGETLVSGYTDCGFAIRAERAEAEIFGETNRSLSAVTPVQYIRQGEFQGSRKKYSLIIGKNRINFYKDSGISGTTCAKMYEEYFVTLPGGFVLPVKLAVETWIDRENTAVEITDPEAEQLLVDFAERYLIGQMTAGQILKGETTLSQEDGLAQLKGEYACLELIGQEQSEEIIDSYEQTD